jgi:hypothetical protein
LGKNGAKLPYFEFVFEIAIIRASYKKYSKVPNFKTFLFTLETKLAKPTFCENLPLQNLEKKKKP